jgi:general secretion pathway protein K
MRTELRMTRNYAEEIKAYYIGLAGFNMAVAELVRKEIFPREESEEEGEEKDPLRVNVDLPPMGFGEGSFVLRIGNESGKIDLNSAEEDTLRMVLGSFSLEDEGLNVIVDSILDWRDKDDLHRPNGAESDYYKRLEKPYRCKNGDFDSVEELLLVRGVTKELYLNGLKDIFTVIPSRVMDSGGLVPMRRPFGPPGWTGRIRGGAVSRGVNINAAPRAVLKALPMMDEALAEAVLEYRRDGDFKSPSEVADVLGADVYSAVSPHLNTQMSPYYTIKSVGMVQGGTVQQGVEVLVKIDRSLPKGFEVLRWMDGISEPVPLTPPSEEGEEKGLSSVLMLHASPKSTNR